TERAAAAAACGLLMPAVLDATVRLGENDRMPEGLMARDRRSCDRTFTAGDRGRNRSPGRHKPSAQLLGQRLVLRNLRFCLRILHRTASPRLHRMAVAADALGCPSGRNYNLALR